MGINLRLEMASTVRLGYRLASLTAAAACALAIVHAASAPGTTASPPPREPALATCFWEGPISTRQRSSRGFDGRYFNFPEESATYWLARFDLPAGASLVLRGRYPHARYMSLNSYSEAAPTDTLSDIRIAPRPGSTNPFIAGNRRDLARRSWRVTVLDEAPPGAGEERRSNTLFAAPQGDAPIELLYRVYEPDRGLDLTGGTGLPHARLTLADASVRRGNEACDMINDPNREITVDTTPEALWETARRAPGCDAATNPAYDPPRWERFFNFEYAALGVIADCTQAGRELRHSTPATLEGGNYSNRDSAYVYSHLSRDFGPVLVLRGKLPRTPRTRAGQPVMGRGQMRFWSLCTGESRVTTYTPDCLADRQVPIDAARNFVIVVSRRADRPGNARRECGVGWLDWGERGDGVGDADYGLLIMRNMLASPGFGAAIQNIPRPGDEHEVMGPYLPQAGYTTTAEFETAGCG